MTPEQQAFQLKIEKELDANFHPDTWKKLFPRVINGKIYYDHIAKVCPICRGEGEVQVTDIEWDECRRCNGTGSIIFTYKK